MTRKTVQKTDPFSDPNVNFFQLPDEIADRWWAKVEGYRDELLDYYIEAVDAEGNVTRSEIQHVYVEDDGTTGESFSEATFSEDPRDCAPLTVTYVAGTGPLSNSVPVELQISFDQGSNWMENVMLHLGGGTSSYTVASVPDNAPSAIVWFQNVGGSIIDSRDGQNWSTTIRDCDAPVGPGTAQTVPDAPDGCGPVSIRYYPNAGVLEGTTQVYARVGRNGWQDVVDPDPAMTAAGSYWEYTYTPTVGTYVIDAAFHDDAGTWDNNDSQDWHFTVSNCVPPAVPDGMVITNPVGEITVANEIASYSLYGTAGTNLSGDIHWTNALTGAGGTISRNPEWVLAGIALAEGTNVLTVKAQSGGSVLVDIATDNGGNAAYDPSWEHGDNDGTGFGPWAFDTNGVAGHFRASGDNPNLNVGPVAWGLYANEGGLASAVRPLTMPLSAGETLSVKFDNNWIVTNGSVGLAMQNSAGDNLFEFIFFGGADNYTIFDGTGGRDSGVQYSDSGLALAFEPSGADGYRFTAGATVITGQLATAADQAVARIRVYNHQAGTGPEYDLFANDLRVTSPGSPVFAGDTVRIVRDPAALQDGIPVSWWQRYGLGSTNTAAGNNDGDIADNAGEYAADTDPTDPASVFTNRVLGFSGAGSLAIQVGPPTTNSRVYDVWVSSNLVNGAWSPMNRDVPGASDGAAVMMTVTGVRERVFYRTGVKVP
jgi:hypothetical protein